MQGATSVSRPAVQPAVVNKTPYRSISGAVQAIESGGKIRFRDDRNGDINVFITAQSEFRKNGQAVSPRTIGVGTRFHGYAAFRGGNWYAKEITID
jgi:hypothetical protein